MAAKAPDKEHPFGYGRIEYMSAIIIAVLVFYAGTTSLVESVKQIWQPETPEYSTVSLVIVALAVVVKIVLGRYVKSMGEKVNSDALINSGEDARLDAVISASTLAAAGIFLLFGVPLEAWLGAIISLVIIKAGLDMLKETVSKILGERNDPELAKSIKQTVLSFPGVRGAYDLVLNNYGPDTWHGSIHIEVPDTYGANQLDKLLREIMMEVMKQHRVALTAITRKKLPRANMYALSAARSMTRLLATRNMAFRQELPLRICPQTGNAHAASRARTSSAPRK